MKRPTKAEVERLLGQHNGSISGLSRSLGIGRHIVQRWCTDYNLRGKGKGGQISTAPSDEEIRASYDRCGGNVALMVAEMCAPRSTVRSWARKLGLEAKGSDKFDPIYPVEVKRSLRNGRIVCFSDCHWWSTDKSRAHEALLVTLKKIKPDIVVAAGDVIDGARISRHDPIGWDDLPKLEDEIYVAQATHGGDQAAL